MALFGMFDDNRRYVKELSKLADKVMALEDEYREKTDDELVNETSILKAEIKDGKKLNEILPRAFATVREAAARVLKMRHFKVQIMGGIALHQGRIAEMKTGEGKTLVSTLPAYLNALTGKGVHVITVNDYLAKRDAIWMGKVHRFLGLTVGVSYSGQTPDDKRKAYACDITYATNNEIGFDYLRDNICTRKEQRVLRELNFGIVDEVDSILIDEARTPLIISGPGTKSSDNYQYADNFVKTLTPDDIDLDIEKKMIRLNDAGVSKAEEYFKIENLGDSENLELHHYINNALRANVIMHLDQDYVNDKGEIKIVDENTGRIMEGRRYNDGLHQAIEAKEGVEIQNENQTMATITFQNLFRMYNKLSGMTGTAKTEEGEFNRIYNLDVVTIPTNKPNARIDENDVVFVTEEGKFRAVLEDAKHAHELGQPVLIGTVNVDKSEHLSGLFKEAGLAHNVLNAKNHAREAEIVAQAGQKGAITIATNMAGRGTDILLGGNPEFLAKQEMRRRGMNEALIESSTAYLNERTGEEVDAKTTFEKLFVEFKKVCDEEKAEVAECGGLRIIGTERHESRRIDNQLRGRSGRQGDPGSSIFYLSLNDDLIKRFGGEMLKRMAAGLSVDEDFPLKFSLLTWSIKNAQKRIEGVNFSQRKYTLEYDDVMNKQRTIIYKQRNSLIDGEDIHDSILDMVDRFVSKTISKEITDDKLWSDWDLENLNKKMEEVNIFKPETNFITVDKIEGMEVLDIVAMVQNEVKARYEKQIDVLRNDNMNFGELERYLLLQVVDKKWIDHIDVMSILKNDIGLRGYAQRDPLIEYKKEGLELFDKMINEIQDHVARIVLNIEITKRENTEFKAETTQKVYTPQGVKEQAAPELKDKRENVDKIAPKPAQAVSNKLANRNDPCPCGSGKKYKNCCGS